MKMFFCDENGILSMKRLCGFICTISLAFAMIIVPFSKSISIPDSLVYTIGSLAFGCLGLTSAEKLLNKKDGV